MATYEDCRLDLVRVLPRVACPLVLKVTILSCKSGAAIFVLQRKICTAASDIFGHLRGDGAIGGLFFVNSAPSSDIFGP